MPHFTLQFQAGGPQLNLLVAVSHPRQQALRDAGMPLPEPVAVRGLVDTGASSTALDPTVIKKLELSPTGSMPILTPSTGDKPHQANTFDVSIIVPIVSPVTFTIAAVQVFESALNVQGIQALLGRDILSNCLLVYDGRNNIFSLAF